MYSDYLEKITVGIDRGVKRPIQAGDAIYDLTKEQKRKKRAKEKYIKRCQMRLSRQKKGSNRRNKQRKKLSKAYEKISNIRKDFCHKTSRAIVDDPKMKILVLEDLKPICRILPTKVIIGSGYLTDEEIKKASRIVKKSGAFCVKTATEKDPLEHIELQEKAKHLQMMAKAAPGLKIKASGKIRTLKNLEMMMRTGADIIGTSSSVKIIQAYKRRRKRR